MHSRFSIRANRVKLLNSTAGSTFIAGMKALNKHCCYGLGTKRDRFYTGARPVKSLRSAVHPALIAH